MRELQPVHPTTMPCPTNQKVGQSVNTLTLKALLAVPLTQVSAAEYRFCQAADCPTVYYSADGAQCFREADLRERVFQKHRRDDSVLVCYCFGHTVGSIRAELNAIGPSPVVEAIETGIRVGQCACDIRNPEGECCLGNVRALVRQLKAELKS